MKKPRSAAFLLVLFAMMLSACSPMDLQALRAVYHLDAQASRKMGALIFSAPTQPRSGPTGARGSSPSVTPEPPQKATIGESCISSADPSRLCIGLKYLVYVRADDSVDELRKQAIQTVEGANRIWSPCEIAFQIDEFVPVDPASYHLRFRTADYRELQTIRRDFEDQRMFLVVTTGNWDRRGTLGNTAANAWTNMPGDGLHGTVLERRVGNMPNMLAHELGHYLSLDHTDDPRNLMYPRLYDDTEELTRSQCRAARGAAREFWPKMLRRESTPVE